MSTEQQYLMHQIAYQRKVCAKLPGDIVEETHLDTLIALLRDTFVVIQGEGQAQQVKTPARGMLKLVG
jgi:hypothetical protein